jgi:hypothetical protein
MYASALILFVLSTGMLFVAQRSRYRFGPNYSVRRVRFMAVCEVLVGVCTIAIGIIDEHGRTGAILRILAGINFLLAGAFFRYAADHRSTGNSGTAR